MPCYHPISAFQSRHVGASGKRAVFFTFSPACDSIFLPCGRCIGCRLERSRQWAVRIMHEASLHEQNCFLTLTYDDEHCPSDFSLNVDHFQRFMKRYRKRYGKLRFFHCGEYGETYLRPHYHACIFGHDFADKIQCNISNGMPLYASASLAELWPYGRSWIGSLTFESAAYVARYCLKKVTGDLADSHYQRVIESTGEVVQVAPEYVTMSRRPGIAADWWRKYGVSDVHAHDRVISRGVPAKPPRYYDKLYELQNPLDFEKIRSKRKLDAEKKLLYDSDRRLSDREEFAKSKLSTFSRRGDL